MRKIVVRTLLMLVLVAGVQLYAKAQVPPDPDYDIPLDPGSWVLAAAGVGYGIKKWRDNKQAKAKQTTNNI